MLKEPQECFNSQEIGSPGLSLNVGAKGLRTDISTRVDNDR